VAISFVSGILIYPVTCRSEIFEVQEKYLEAVRDMLQGTGSYLGVLQTTPTLSASQINYQSQDENEGMQDKCDGAELRGKMAGVKTLYVKMHEELAWAKREIAWGKLRAVDINSINDLCRQVLMPL
jgi:Putative ER transporter, 6TM, N-terminal